MEGVELRAGLEEIEPVDDAYVGLLVVGMAGQYAGGMLTNRIPAERGLIGIVGVLAVLAFAFLPVTSHGLLPLVLFCGVLEFFLFAI